ncbi:GD23173 [Drosophila simulans]|uniref:GD23173 n=1 Tax=Drosophila simulans TaxID=7240 RepID=B4Q8I8_DROSI|nr:GD23173 [Drosophila simulans]
MPGFATSSPFNIVFEDLYYRVEVGKDRACLCERTMFDFNVNVKRDRDRMSAQSTQENAADGAADFAVDLWLPFVDNAALQTPI